MTMKSIACVTAIALLAGTACFTVPADAQGAPVPHHAKMSSAHSRTLFMSAVAEYDAGLRRGRASATNDAYLRGFRDGTSSEAYSSRAYAMNRYAANPAAIVSPNTGASVARYSPYERDAVYAPVTGGYSSYNQRSISYNDGFATDRYDSGYAPRGLMDVAVAPDTMAASSEAHAAHLSYCAARYRSFDPASDTFLANDGNRYYCR
jgi:BA14K-like protein